MVTGKVELRPVPGRKRPHEDVEVVEVWLLCFLKGRLNPDFQLETHNGWKLSASAIFVGMT